jgi:hypothetical protein
VSRATIRSRGAARRRIRTTSVEPAPTPPPIFPELHSFTARVVDVSTGAPAHLHGSIKVFDDAHAPGAQTSMVHVEIVGTGLGFTRIVNKNVLEFSPCNLERLREVGLFLCELARRGEALVVDRDRQLLE